MRNNNSDNRKNDLCERLFNFSINVILYLHTVKNALETIDMKRQLIRASTSSGANYKESQGSYTKPDARAKIGISLKEVREANFFLRIVRNLELGGIQLCDDLIKESLELKLILGSIMNKIKT